MQGRRAVVLSLGMLLEKVDTSVFIMKLLGKAKEENKDFVFTPEMQRQAFTLSEMFNCGIEPESFRAQLMRLLGINGMHENDFWDAWKSMVTVGNIAEKIQLLQQMTREQNVLVYLSSDTNVIHLREIAAVCSKQGIALDVDSQQPRLASQFPLYASYRAKMNRQDLAKHIVGQIHEKEVNKQDAITLLLGNPDNIRDKGHQAIARRECDLIAAWCAENNVAVMLHNNVLSETLHQLFSPQPLQPSPAACSL